VIGASGASAEPASGPSASYIVTFAAGVGGAQQTSDIAAANASDVSAIPQLRMHAIYASDVAAAALSASADVVRVEADATRSVQAAPSDADYSQQWSLPAIGWDQVFGSVSPPGTATVAVLDTGVDASHPDLAGQLVPGTSVLEPTSDGITDPNGHGTWMAGIIAASTDNGIGIAGIGYAGVRLMPVTVLRADGTGSDSDIISGVLYAADHGADVILMSFSNPGYSDALQAAIDYAWSKGAVVVAATGNDGSPTATFPAGDRGVVGVSSTNFMDSLDLSSNYGADTFLAAPGAGIETTTAGGGYATISGTSAAAAEVAGAAALLKANDSSASNGVIVGRLARNADTAGTSDQTGNGRLNLARALADASVDSVEPVGSPPVGGGGPFVGPYVAAAISASATFPVDSAAYTTSSFNAGNGTPAGDIAGSVNFNNGSINRTVGISIKRNSDGQYWNGSSFSGGTTEVFNSVCTPGTCPIGNGSANWTYSFSAPADGSYLIHAKASDSGGTTTTADLTFTIDNAAPTTASVTTPANGGSFGAASAPTTFSGSAADNAGGVGLNANSTTFTFQRPDGQYWNGTAWQAGVSNRLTTSSATTGNTLASWTSSSLGSWVANAGSTDGTYTVQATATDKAGNAFRGSAITFTLDKTAATVTIDSVSPSPTSGGTTVAWHANENGAYSVRVGGTNCTTGTVVDSGNYTTQPNTVASVILAGSLVEAANTIRVCDTDAAGNVGSTTATVTKDSTNPITASVTTPAPASSFIIKRFPRIEIRPVVRLNLISR